MVLVEELADEVQEPSVSAPEEGGKSGSTHHTKLQTGFLQTSKETLYGPEGSPEGRVAPETHKAHAEHKVNQKLEEGFHRGARDNNGIESPPWYTADWPKECQYNAPGCTLEDLDKSEHPSDAHKAMVRDSSRWDEAMAPGAKAMRLSFMSIVDEDLKEIIERLKGNESVTELDLTHNKIKDAGIQSLVAALAGGAAPNLQQLRLHDNEFGELSQTMLTQGLAVFRKKLDVQWKEPSWAKIVRDVEREKTGAATA